MVRATAALPRSCVRRIEHIGSTSVPGLAAKPTIDVLVAVDDPLDDEIKDDMERAGYRLRVEEPEHRMFRHGQHDVHVHLWADDSPEIERHVVFRERLRANESERTTYERLRDSQGCGHSADLGSRDARRLLIAA
ncbi:MAG: GrpB family protein [Candidatus Baltobacteraceae bacterium]